MTVKVHDYFIDTDGNQLTNNLFVLGKRGTRSGANPAMFKIEHGGANPCKVMSGTGTYANGSRVTFPYSFSYRCFGLSVQHYDELSVNWDYNSGTHGGEVTVVYASGTYDATGFYLYSSFSWQSAVAQLSGNFSYCWTAWGI